MPQRHSVRNTQRPDEDEVDDSQSVRFSGPQSMISLIMTLPI